MSKLPERLPAVRIYPAGCFTCDRCGQDTYFPILAHAPEEFSAEILAELNQLADTDGDGGEGVIYSLPEVVSCQNCGAGYRPYENPAELPDLLDDNYDEDEA